MKNGKKQFALLTSASVITLALVGCGATPNSLNMVGVRGGSFNAQSVPGEVVVKFKDARSRQSALQKLGLRTVAKVNRLEAVVVKCANPSQTIADLKRGGNVLYAEPNYIAKAVGLANPAPRMGFGVRSEDELLGKLWEAGKDRVNENPSRRRGLILWRLDNSPITASYGKN